METLQAEASLQGIQVKHKKKEYFICILFSYANISYAAASVRK